jgi:hypothetical protein
MGVQGGTASGVAFRIEPDGTCVIGQETGKCSTTLGSLSYTGSRGLSRYSWKIKDDELTISARGAIPMVFRRVNTTQPNGQAPTGGPFTETSWGVSLVIPDTWKIAAIDTGLLLGSDSEPGLMLVKSMKGASREMLEAEFNQGIQDSGISLMPTAKAQAYAVKTRTGIAGEFAGAGQKGERLRGRMIGILTGYGDAIVFVGVTGEAQFPTLKSRLDWMANSVTFTQPAN